MLKQKWNSFFDCNGAAASCYFLIPALLFLSGALSPSIRLIGAGLLSGLVILIAAAIIAPKGSRLKFHAVQASMLTFVISVIVLPLVFIIFASHTSNRSDAEGVGSFFVALMAVIVLGIGVVLIAYSLYLIITVFQGRDVVLPLLGEFAPGVFNENSDSSSPYDNFYHFEGKWSNGKRNGKGSYTYPDGSSYEGDFADGLRAGKGILTLADGSRYEGDFVGDKFHGYGAKYNPDGSIFKQGQWEKDNFVGLK